MGATVGAGVGSTIVLVKIDQFESNVIQRVQQKNKRVAQYLMQKSMESRTKYIDRLGTTEMHERVGRNQLVEADDAEFDRRKLTMRPYAWAHYTDVFDKLQTIHDPTGELAISAMAAAMRRMDIIAITGLLGTAYEGENNPTAVNIPKEQKYVAASSGAIADLNIEALIAVRQIFWENEAIENEGDPIYLATTSKDIAALLRDTKVQSADYNTVKALVAGEVNTFMGFVFLRTELLPRLEASLAAIGVSNGVEAAANSRRNAAFVTSGACMGIGQDVQTSLDRIPQRYNSMLLQLNMAMGSTRLEEEKVVELITKA